MRSILILAIVGISVMTFALFDRRQDKSPIHQLRIYEVPVANGEAFHKRFKEHAMRIMENHGFKIVSIWETNSGGVMEFVYLLQWNTREEMTASWTSFMADKEWISIKAKTSQAHGTFVNRIEDRVLTPQEYSPVKNLLLKE